MLRNIHRIYGIVVVLVFLGTGQYMLHRHPAMTEIPTQSRLLYRSAHIYLVMAGLLNLAVGTYLSPGRKWLQLPGSILLLLSPVLIFWGFATESMRPVIDRNLTSLGVYTTFAGTLLHALSGAFIKTAAENRKVAV